MPPRKFRKISPSEIESESIFSDLAKLQADPAKFSQSA